MPRLDGVPQHRATARKATPTGGVGHPFEGGTVDISLRWDGEATLSTRIGDELVPPQLEPEDARELDLLFTAIRRIVYIAQWNARTEVADAQV